jgi:hypothetical protein
VAGGDTDFDAYLLAVGATVDLGSGMNVHGQVFSATGNEEGTSDTEAFGIPQGQSYYWSEIMGFGIFDNQASANACADQISDIVAANIGMGFTPIPDLTVDVDLWYATLAEDDSNGEDELGTEIDIKASYKIMSNLNLDVVAAYLFTGDATYKGDDQEDAMEIGTQLSLSF